MRFRSKSLLDLLDVVATTHDRTRTRRQVGTERRFAVGRLRRPWCHSRGVEEVKYSPRSTAKRQAGSYQSGNLTWYLCRRGPTVCVRSRGTSLHETDVLTERGSDRQDGKAPKTVVKTRRDVVSVVWIRSRRRFAGRDFDFGKKQQRTKRPTTAAVQFFVYQWLTGPSAITGKRKGLFGHAIGFVARAPDAAEH